MSLCLILLPAVAGVLTLQNRRLGAYLSIATFGTQLVSVSTTAFSYRYVLLASFPVYWSSADAGITGWIGPTLKIHFGTSGLSFVGIDILSLIAMGFLVKTLRVPANNRWSGRET